MQIKFLAAFRVHFCIDKALRHVGCGMNNHHVWMCIDGEYRKAFNATLKEMGDAAEAELARIAFEGHRKLVVDKGCPVFVWVVGEGEAEEVVPEEVPGARLVPLYEIKKSEAALFRILEASKPEKYKPRTETQINANVNSTSRVTLYLPANEPRDEDNPTASGTTGEVPSQ